MNNPAQLPVMPTVLRAGDVRLLSALRFQMLKRAPDQKHVQRTWVLEMFTSGQLSVRTNDHPWRVFHRLQGVLYAPGTVWYEERRADLSPCESCCLLFELSATPTTDAWRAHVGDHRGIEDPQGLLLPLLEQALRHHTLGGADDLLAQGAFLQAMGHLFRAIPRPGWLTITDAPPQEDLLARTHRYMRANLHRPLSIADFARQMKMSESGFAHSYRRLAGVSPMVELRRLRIEVARGHLVAARYSLAEIATLAGFADAFHLSRTFKKITGQSPRDFRRLIHTPR